MTDLRPWIPIALSIIIPAAGLYAGYKVMEWRLEQLEQVSDAGTLATLTAEQKALAERLSEFKDDQARRDSAQWQAIRELRR